MHIHSYVFGLHVGRMEEQRKGVLTGAKYTIAALQ